MRKPIVGYGDEISRRGRTHTANAFIMTETTPVAGGAEVRITPRRNHVIMPEVEVEDGEVIIHIRKDAGPHIGEVLSIGKRHIIVGGRRFDNHGRMQVMDADTHVWHVLDDGRGQQ